MWPNQPRKVDRRPQRLGKGSARAFGYLGDVVWAGTVDLWRSIQRVQGIGLVGTIVAIIGGGVALAKIFNVAWFVAAAFVVQFLLSFAGGYRVWSKTDKDLVEAIPAVAGSLARRVQHRSSIGTR